MARGHQLRARCAETRQRPQRKLAHELLKSGLSQRGYMTATGIMDLETVLGALEAAERASAPQPPRGQPLVRDTERYFFSVFGKPGGNETWGWRVEGHHVALNFTVANGRVVAGTPAFLGSNPGEVREGPRKGPRGSSSRRLRSGPGAGPGRGASNRRRRPRRARRRRCPRPRARWSRTRRRRRPWSRGR